jgi:hypothetical protein
MTNNNILTIVLLLSITTIIHRVESIQEECIAATTTTTNNQHQPSFRTYYSDCPKIYSCEEFITKCYNKHPCIFSSPNNMLQPTWKSFIQSVSKESLSMRDDLDIQISTANSYTGRMIQQMTIAQYTKFAMDYVKNTGNETLYFFGFHYGKKWEEFMNQYPLLLDNSSPITGCVKDFPQPTMALGAGPFNTGVPWHFHGAGFLQVLIGSKRWFLNSPQDIPLPTYDPNATVLSWWTNYQEFYHQHHHQPESLLLNQQQQQQHDQHNKLGIIDAITPKQKTILVCDLLQPGDTIYFPPKWYHATLNIGQEWNAWVATFV